MQSVLPKLAIPSGFTCASENFFYSSMGPIQPARKRQNEMPVRAPGSLHDQVQFATTTVVRAGDT